MAIAASIATSAHPEKSIWTHNPTMYVAYGFLALAALLGANALGLLGKLRSAVVSFLPSVRIEAPKRRIRLRRRGYDTDHARALVSAGRMGERLSESFDVGEPEITPKSVAYRLGPKQQAARSELAKAAAGHAAETRALIQRGKTLLAEVEALRKPTDPHTARYEKHKVMSQSMEFAVRYAFLGPQKTNTWLADVSRLVSRVSPDLVRQLYPEPVKNLSAEQTAIERTLAVLDQILEAGL
jgi:hypothetical protein